VTTRWMLLCASVALAMTSVALAHHWVRRGEATYYGDQYVGQTMVCGGVYRHRKMVAAARSRRLACGTILRVKNLRNGRVVTVKVKDYMARDADAIIDVSRRAARRLRFLRAGRARVRIWKQHS
jgi:rare lipoprotein A